MSDRDSFQVRRRQALLTRDKSELVDMVIELRRRLARSRIETALELHRQAREDSHG